MDPIKYYWEDLPTGAVHAARSRQAGFARVENLRCLKPLYPGDTLPLEHTIVALRVCARDRTPA